MPRIFHNDIGSVSKLLFVVFLLLSLFSTVVAVVLETPVLFALPVLLVGGLVVVIAPRVFPPLYFVLLPFSMEIEVGASLGTDLPSEPLMLLLLGMAVTYILAFPARVKKFLITHPISLIIVAQVSWTLFTAVTGTQPLIGIKHFAAKIWYIGSMFLLPLLWYERDEVLRLVRYTIVATIPIAIWILGKHAMSGFGFEEANFVMKPFFRNHVTYAVYLLMLIPFVYAIWRRSRSEEKRAWPWMAVLILFIVALYFNYTRMAHIGLVALPIAALIMRYRLTLVSLLAAIMVFAAITVWLTTDNKYMEIAPDYTTTVAHKNFEDLLDATLKGKDVSSMERVYRWVAAGFMIGERPITGYGPASFYESYKPYTVYAFRTYVSDNPERSGIHNYFLMLFVEQGIIGLGLFLGLWVFALFRAERIYHASSDPFWKLTALIIYLTMISIGLVQLLNDLIETDKIGSIFYVSLALLVIMDTRRSKE